MTLLQKHLFVALITVALFAVAVFIGKVNTSEGQVSVTTTASSTAFTLTTTSQRLLATSTKRTAYSVQPTYCTGSPAGTVYMMANKDVVAVASTGFAVTASSTQMFGEGQKPVDTNAVQGITDAGTCTVLVTEWRYNF